MVRANAEDLRGKVCDTRKGAPVDELITGKPNEINGICCKNGRGDNNFWQLIIVEGTNIVSKHAFGKEA